MNKPSLGLCCIFKEQSIHFKTTTATALCKINNTQAIRNKLSSIVLHNTKSLLEALSFCQNNNIECFRITSRFLPLKTHPVVGYQLNDLPDHPEIIANLTKCKDYQVRKCFHPDQFVVLNSPKHSVVENSVAEIEYQTELAFIIGADVINIHAGGCYGDKISSLNRLQSNLDLLSPRARSLLTFENDDKSYTPQDLYKICDTNIIPLVYDVHHHRCNPDSWSIEEATEKALSTWNCKPLFHISSPINGWNGKKQTHHHDYIDINDFPAYWMNLDITVEIEAKAKELAIAKLQADLANRHLGSI